MGEREIRRIQRSQEDMNSYIRETAGTGGKADELAKLADLKTNGHITAEEFEKAKAKVLAA
jgi:hypothetical protein